MKYSDLVQYIKDNHVNWNTDLFDVLRGFFDSKYSLPTQYSPPPSSSSPSPSPQVKAPPLQSSPFQEPANGEYTSQDLINLFNT